jgi:hypothetical protein
LAIFVLATVLDALGARQAHAEPRDAAITATITPSPLPLGPGESSTAMLVLRNSSEERVEQLAVAALEPPSGVTVDLVNGGLATTTLPPGAATSVSMRITRETEGVAAEIPFQIDIRYRQIGVVPPGGGAPPAPAIDQRTVAVGTVLAAEPRELLTATFAGDVDPVSEDRPRRATLVLTNPRAQPVTITRLEISSPRSLRSTVSNVLDLSEAHVEPGQVVDLLAEGGGFELAGRGQAVVPIDLTVDKRLDPGPRLLFVRATVEQHGEAAEVIATQAVTVEVFGESEILGALGVPMIWLLPGLIILVIAAFLITRLSPWRAVLGSSNLDVPAKASLGAVVSVALSLLIVAAYPILTDLYPGEPRNLLVAYGFADFQYIYAWSFVIAVTAWLLAFGVLPAWRWAFVPAVGDEPPELLRKLAWRRWPAEVDLLAIDDGSTPKVAACGPLLGTKRFAFPPLLLRGTPLEDSRQRELRNALANGNLFRARRVIRKAPGKRKVEFASDGYIGRPKMADPDKAQPNGLRVFVVDVP